MPEHKTFIFYSKNGIQYLQKCHERGEVVELNLLSNVLGFDIIILVGNEDKVTIVSPTIFLHPVLQGYI